MVNIRGCVCCVNIKSATPMPKYGPIFLYTKRSYYGTQSEALGLLSSAI